MKINKKWLYWITTGLLCLGMLSGGTAQLMQLQQNTDGIKHLGYPTYLLTILGVWKILGSVALLVPQMPLYKEWAYAGFFFVLSGALFSHLYSADGIKEIAAPIIFILLTVLSWYLRPSSRKILLHTPGI